MRTRNYGRFGEPLEPFEVRVLAMASNGSSNLEIARATATSENMVKYYLQKACTKLGARNRAHAVRRGFEEGYLQHMTAPATSTKPDHDHQI
jgi:DNA-binding NarL/FixJ family response regulator